jgi:hypothetical protein
VQALKVSCPQCGFLIEASPEDALCRRCLLLANFETQELGGFASRGTRRLKRIGVTLDRKYHIERPLGHGGMGSVYLAGARPARRTHRPRARFRTGEDVGSGPGSCKPAALDHRSVSASVQLWRDVLGDRLIGGFAARRLARRMAAIGFVRNRS